VNYPRINAGASCFNEGLLSETEELPSLQASIRANPALLRYVLVSLGQVSTDGKQLSIATKRLPKYILTILGIGFIQQPLTY
jgi:hypothetical protein